MNPTGMVNPVLTDMNSIILIIGIAFLIFFLGIVVGYLIKKNK